MDNEFESFLIGLIILLPLVAGVVYLIYKLQKKGIIDANYEPPYDFPHTPWNHPYNEPHDLGYWLRRGYKDYPR